MYKIYPVYKGPNLPGAQFAGPNFLGSQLSGVQFAGKRQKQSETVKKQPKTAKLSKLLKVPFSVPKISFEAYIS